MHSEVELVLRADFLSAVELEIARIRSGQGRRDKVAEALLARTTHMRILHLITPDEASEIRHRTNVAFLG